MGLGDLGKAFHDLLLLKDVLGLFRLLLLLLLYLLVLFFRHSII